MTRLAPAAALVLALFAVFNSNLRGIGSRDTRVTEHVAFSLAAYGRADLDAFPELHETGLAKGWLVQSGGHVRSTYPIVPALLASPAYGAAIVLGVLPRNEPPLARIEVVGKLVASGTTAAACAVLFVIVRRRASGRLSAAIAATAALATPLWSTASQALWSHGPAALLLAVGVLAANVDLGRATSSEPASRPLWPLFVAGLAFALAAACRPLLAGFFVGHVYAAWKMRGGSSALAVAVGALVVTLPIAAWNVATFGHLAGGATIVESAAVHQAAHGVSSPWSANPLAGLAGILVSPSRGLLIYMPIALVAVAGAREILKRRALEVWSLLVPTAFFVAGWSMYSVWWGGHSYGPRYAADLALPLALLSVAALTSVQAISRTARASAIAVLSWSLFVQAVGAFSYPGGEWNGTPADVDRAHARLWDWRDSQIPRTVQAGIYRPFVNRLDD